MTNIYDLEERTTIFSERLIDFYKKCPRNIITIPLIDQGLRAGTSIGANYMEANGASSKKDFKNKIFICKKEGKETMYWLRLTARVIDEENLKEECRFLWKETHELTLIFSKIASKTK
ncbi:four helix bundle protein [Patescibacteria group bacterium]|nr:four helix bundle protein [Patescibacteria group bacterium]MCL5091553.1 four helix bundle protein [Patescibacteria group bacterium]